MTTIKTDEESINSSEKAAETAKFEKLEKELADYNLALSKDQKPAKPQIDQETLLKLRD